MVEKLLFLLKAFALAILLGVPAFADSSIKLETGIAPVTAELDNVAPQVEVERSLEKSMHDPSWWDPAYKEAVKQDDCPTAISVLNIAQKAGSIAAHIKLAALYRYGICLNKDIAKADALLRYGAERGDAEALFSLAQMHYIEKGQSNPSAKEWAYRAQFAMMDMGTDYWKKISPLLHIDEPLSPDLKQALSWLEKTENEDSSVLFTIGKDFLEHGTWPESRVLACYWLNKAAQKGHVRASYLFARQVLLGDGVVVAPLGAINRLYDAMKGGDVDAYLLAAQLLEQGSVSDQSYDEAYLALMRAQALGADVTKSMDRVASHLNDLQLQEIMRLYALGPSRYPRFGNIYFQNDSFECAYASRRAFNASLSAARNSSILSR